MAEAIQNDQATYLPISSNLIKVLDKGIANVIQNAAPEISADEKRQLTQNIREIIAPYINKYRHKLDNPGEAADLIITKLFEPTEGEEDLSTKAGRTAKRLRELGAEKIGFNSERITKIGIKHYLKKELRDLKEEAKEAIEKDHQIIALGSNLNKLAENSMITQPSIHSQQNRPITLIH